MYSLVYSSEAEPIVNAQVIQDILEKSRSFNKENAVTGCLLYYEGNFIQYIEGKRSVILGLFERIKADHRHRQVKLLASGHCEEREFLDWSMAYTDFLGDNDHLQFLRLLVDSFVENPVKSMDPNPSSKYFWRTARRLLKSHSHDRFQS